jgi:hypothetical protein
VLALAVVAGACGGGGNQATPTSSSTSSPIPTASTSPSPSVSALGALITSLPAGCDGAAPSAGATIAFVAEGRAWAVAPNGSELTCLFKVADPGPFAWGPRADRVVVGGLEVRGVGVDVSRPAGSVDPPEVSWGRPEGLALVFIDPDGKRLEKARVGSTTFQDVTPAEEEGHFPSHADLAFQEVVYHPSGGAFGFVMTDFEGSAVWVSTNTGQTPTRLIWSEEGTVFGPIAFAPDGSGLYYGAHLANGTTMISREELGQTHVTTGLWLGKQDVLRMVPGPDGAAMALDTGTGCADRVATLSHLDSTAGSSLLPAATGPTSVVGWLDASTVLVAEGGCSGPLKMWIAPIATGATPTLVADGVDRAAVRIPEPLPPPPIPDFTVDEGVA